MSPNNLPLSHTNDPYVRQHDWIYTSQMQLLDEISKQEGVSRSKLVREIFDKYLKVYLHRKGTFICQDCGSESKNRERHEIQVGEETFIFGDCCFFSDSYKEVIRQLI